jgi:hypothetical protein
VAAADAFHAAYWVIFAVAVLGAVTAMVAFPWRATQPIKAGGPAPAHAPVIPERTGQSA